MDTDITILYGSQTGNAEDMAKRIGYRAKSLGYSVLVEAMDDFPLKTLTKPRTIVFVCSTTGHGQEPENMKNFYNFIRRRDLPSGCLAKLRFTVYGLGDSSYAKFNYVSKILFKRLKECGAQPIQELVIGDEQHPNGCDGTIYPGLAELWHKLGNAQLEMDFVADHSLPYRSYDVQLHQPGDIPRSCDIFSRDYVTRYDIKSAVCTANERITPESHFQDTRLLCLTTEELIDYEPGDVCTILPANSEENVHQLLNILDLKADQTFSLKKRDSNYMINYLYDFVPAGLTVYELVKYYLDIQSVPRRSFFEFLWPFSDNDLEKDKLKEFASTEGQEEMYEYCILPKRSILEVLLDFPRTVKNVTFDIIFDLIPPIKPRSFSIASALIMHPQEVHLIVGVVRYRTRLRKIREGLCSNFLAKLRPTQSPLDSSPGSRVNFFIKRSSFKLPLRGETPILMIGPGLGIAPFRGFLEQRSTVENLQKNNYLYFGCRFRNADFYFREELEGYVEKDILRLKVAFSREEPKQYVQDIILADSDDIKRLIMVEKAFIYVAGNSKLPEDVRVILGKILTDESESSSKSKESFIADLEARGIINYDCW